MAIDQATDDTYAISADDQGHLLSCEVTATNGGGALAETSDPIAVPALLGAPVSTQAPVVSGTAALGGVLASTSGGWSGTVADVVYQWERGGVAIGDATGSSYTVGRADCGASLTCVVTASNDAGQTSVSSDAVAVTTAPVVALRLSSARVKAGRSVAISGSVTNALAAAHTVAICRKSAGKLIVLERLTVSGAGAFHWKMKASRAGKWTLVATYKAAGVTFRSKAVTLTVRR